MAITIDQAAIGTPVALGTSSTTVAITTNVTIAAGALIIVTAGCDPPALSVDSCSGGGLTWTKDVGAKQSQASAETAAIFSAPAPSGLASGTTITVTLQAASSSRWIGGISVLGADTSASRIDGTPPASHEGSTTAWSSTSYTVAAGTIIVAATTYDINQAGTATSPAVLIFTVPEATGGNEFLAAYQIVSAGGATVLAGTFAVSASTSMTIAVGYKVASSVAVSAVAKPFPYFIMRTPAGPRTLRYPPAYIQPVSTVSIFQQAITATVNVTANLQKQINKAISATVSITASVQKQINKAISTSVAVSANLTRQINKPISATVNISASLQKQVNKIISSTVTLSANLQKQINKLISSTVNITAGLSAQKVILVAITATVNVAASIQKQVNKTFSATVNISAALQKQINKSIQATVNITATLSALKVIIKVITATVNVSASLSRQIKKNISATVNLTASISKLITKNITANIVVSASVSAIKSGVAIAKKVAGIIWIGRF